MKLIYSLVFSLATITCLAQNNINTQFGVKISVGPTSYYNPQITNVGFQHDYQYGQATQIGIFGENQLKNWNLSAGISYQYLFFAYRGVALTTNSQVTYSGYNSLSTQQATQLQFGCSRSFRHGLELGLNVLPTFLFQTTDSYTINNYFSGEQGSRVVNKNAPEWQKAQLIGGIAFSKKFISKRGQFTRLTLNPLISLTNNGGLDVYNQPFTNKTRLVSCQLAYSFYIR